MWNIVRIKKFAVCFGLRESSLPFQRKEDQIDTVYGKKNSSLACWLCFSLFLSPTQIIYGFSFMPPLNSNQFLKLLIGYPTVSFGSFSRGQLHWPDDNHCVSTSRPDVCREPRSGVDSLSLVKHLVGFEPGTFQF